MKERPYRPSSTSAKCHSFVIMYLFTVVNLQGVINPFLIGRIYYAFHSLLPFEAALLSLFFSLTTFITSATIMCYFCASYNSGYSRKLHSHED